MQQQRQQQQQQQPGPFARISQNIDKARKGYEQLVHAVIRPPRAKYSVKHLGPAEFTFLKQRFKRTDVVLPTQNMSHPETPGEEPQPLKMHASVWTRVSEDKPDPSKPKTMVVYLHGNASARIEVLPNLSFLLAQGVYGVCSLDFTGSGKSDGDYVSLGYYERYDLECCLRHLQETYGPNLEIVLWGRSMGASTALMHASKKTQDSILVSTGSEDEDDTPTDPTKAGTTILLKGLICDSPFASLPQLCEELVERARSQGIIVPGIVVSVAIAMISRSVRNLAHFDIQEIAPLSHAPTINVPALFVVGADDDFIPPHHSEDLIEKYKRGVSTNLFMVPGGHNDPRPEIVFIAIDQFLKHRLSLGENDALEVPPGLAKSLHRNPPWVYERHPDIFKAETATTGATSAEVEELGMTKERQDDIQNKIHAVLGQELSA